jgi:iron complex outermembrane receptor protein
MRRLTLRGCLLLSVAMVPAQAWAQSEGAASAQPADEADTAGSGIEEIVVTARKREENLRDVPISISAVSGQALTTAKITQVVDLASRIPNFTVSSGANLPFSLIRGFGSGNNVSFDQAVGKFIDNISYGRDQDIRLPLFDVERVEVLKGPQVLLYGNSATAGVLNITTKKPGDKLAANGSVAYGVNFNEIVSQAGVTIPLGQDVAVRLSGIYQYRDKGPVFNELTGEHDPQARNYATRAILRATPAEGLTVTLKAEYDRMRETGSAGEVMSPPIFSFLTLPDTRLDAVTSVDNNAAPFFQPAFLGLRNVTYQGDLNYDLGDGTLTSTTGYRDMKFAQSLPSPTPVPVLNAYLAYRYKQFSQELRYSGSFGALDATIGGYFQRDTFDVWSAIDFNLTPTLPPGVVLPPFALNGNLDQVQKSYSLFGDFTYHITDALSIEAGARYSWIRKNADQSLVAGDVVPGKDFNSGPAALSPNPALTPFYVLGTGVLPHAFSGLKLRDEFFQPQVVLQYKIAPKSQLFLKYVRGEKAGGFDYFYTGVPPLGPTPAGAQFNSERAESYEAGVKGLVFDNMLDFSLVAFRTTFTNLQASIFQTASFVVANVGKARTQGIELELNYAPIQGLRINASGAYLDAKYLDFPGQPCTVAQAIANGGTDGCFQDLSGTRTQFASKWTGTLSIDYQWPLSSSLDMVGGLALFARSKYNASPNHEPMQEQKAYAKLDGHLDLKTAEGNWTLSLFGKNLTDEKTLDFGADAPGTGKALTGFLSTGREIGIRFGFNF